MKYYKNIGWLACVLLFISCFLPWAYYPDLHKNFTGFFSEQNTYGKPGIIFISVALISVVLISLNKIWAKRTHIFICALNTGYLIRTYILFTSCYQGYCPEKKIGLLILTLSCATLMIVCLFPDLKLTTNDDEFR